MCLGDKMIKCKIDIVSALKQEGYIPYYIRNNKVFGERVMTKFRNGGLPSHNELNTLCKLLRCQPGDILEYVPDEE